MRNVVFMAYSFTTKSNFSFCSRYDTGDGRKGPTRAFAQTLPVIFTCCRNPLWDVITGVGFLAA